MAVDKSKVIVRLKALFPKANLSQKRLDALADKLAIKPADDADDAAIDVVINDFNSVLSIEDIARDDDRVRTLEAKANPPAPAPTPPTPPTPEPPKDDVPPYVKALMDKLDGVTSDLETIKSGKVIETKKATASELFGKSEILKKIPETIRKNWENRIDVNSDTPLEEQIQALESEYSELVQANADTNNYAGAAGGGNPSSAVDEKLVEDIVNTM